MTDPYTETVSVSRTITHDEVMDMDMAKVDDIVSAMGNELVDQLVSAVERATGVPCARDSFLPTLTPADHDGGLTITIYWSPPVARGVAFVGGPMDGAVVELPVPHLQGPPSEIAGMAIHAKTKRAAKKELVRQANADTLPKYKRWGIDPHFDRWVYRYAG